MARPMLKPTGGGNGAYDRQRLTLCGQGLLADKSGVLYWPGQDTLIVSDMHLEKGSAWARRGSMLPPYDTRDTLLRLMAALERFDPACVVCLGDSFHDRWGADRMSQADRQILSILQDGRRWIWVTGNHDPDVPAHLGGDVVEAVTFAGITLRHEPRDGRATHEIAGHLHPAARISVGGATLRRPCFIGNGHRIVMPAFGAFTGGLNVLDEAFAPLFSDGFSVWLRGEDGLYPVSTRRLCHG